MSDGYHILDNKPSTPSATPAVTGGVHRPRLTTAGFAGLLGLTWRLFMLPISIIGGCVGLITGSIGLGFWVAGSVLYYSLSMIGLPDSRRNRVPPWIPPTVVLVSASKAAAAVAAPESMDFLSEFESRYGKTHPNFVPEGFTEAVQRSRREFKLLFVYLHSPEHPDTPAFCKETLCSDGLSEFVNENFVAWGDSISENEGLKMSKCLKASKFPFWAVIMAAAGQSITLLRQFEGPSSPEEMLSELQSVLTESAPVLVAAKVDMDEHINDTLESDQANEHQKKEDQTQVDDEAALARFLEEKASLLGPEPEKGPDVTQVLVRLPNGERKGRRFYCTDKLQSLYDFVDSSGCLEIGSYTLVTFFPRVLYGEDDLSSTLEELGLYPQASLFVELNT